MGDPIALMVEFFFYVKITEYVQVSWGNSCVTTQ